MRSRLCRLVACCAAVLAGAGAIAAPDASAAVPSPLPAGWVIFDSNTCGQPTCISESNFELYARSPSGTIEKITNDANYDSWWGKISPDRTKILFHRTDAGLREIDFQKTSTWQINVDGTNPVKLIGASAGLAAPNPFNWLFQAHAEWAPVLGNAIAILAATPSQLSRPQIYLLPYANNAVGAPYQVTHGATAADDRPGLNLDPAWSPDQTALLFVGCVLNPGRTACDTTTSQQEVFRFNLFTGPETRLTYTPDKSLNYDPYYSPNGQRIAYLHETECTRWGIRAIPAAGGPSTSWDVIEGGTQDGVLVNSKPAWSADSSTIAFHRYPNVQSLVSSIGVGGTGLTALDPAGACFNQFPSNTSSGPTPPTPPPYHAPPLPTSTVVFESNRCAGTPPCQVDGTNTELYLRTAAGAVTQLTDNADYDSFAPKISPNRSEILFYRTIPSYRRDSLHFSLWVMRSDGTGTPTQLIGPGSGPGAGNPYGWVRQSGASWAPQGNYIAMSAATAAQETATPKSPQIYFVSYTPRGLLNPPSVGSSAYRVSYGANGALDRPGANIEPSWHPDQNTLLFVGCGLNAARTGCDLVNSTSNEIILTASVFPFEFPPLTALPHPNRPVGSLYHDPSFSPNGQNIVASLQVTCSQTDLRRMNGDGSGLTVLYTNGFKNLHPQWSSDSNTVYFDRYVADVRPFISQITVQPSPLPGTGLTSLTASTPCASAFPSLVP